MARFFVPPLAQGEAEGAYEALREQAEECTGVSSTGRRIEGIECRQMGADVVLRVGESDAGNGRTVEAIFQLGREAYTVHHSRSGTDESEPTVLRRKDVYSVTDFE